LADAEIEERYNQQRKMEAEFAAKQKLMKKSAQTRHDEEVGE
jgi:hypothetical protein